MVICTWLIKNQCVKCNWMNFEPVQLTCEISDREEYVMEYSELLVEKVGRVGVLTLNRPPKNSFSKKLLKEMLTVLEEFEKDDDVRTVFLKSTGEHFSRGADADDIKKALAGQVEDIKESFAELGGALVEKIDNYPKSTIVAARGRCIGGSTAVFNAFDIRIVGESFYIKDGDIYYGTVGSWGMSSLRLPIWIGRNRIMDYMFLNEGFTGRQAYELGIASKVVADELVDEVGMHYAQKMSTAAPLAVKHFKECVRKALYGATIEEARVFELDVAEKIMKTEDAKAGLSAVIRGEQAEFQGK
ncbi:MAG: enoyl-CoA hydratase/isomerase family protein [Ruminococcaceae bacterium]|nr:enoyl-CoA hydratase/isomerase family protein [Oscillospiraceae bacterium]